MTRQDEAELEIAILITARRLIREIVINAIEDGDLWPEYGPEVGARDWERVEERALVLLELDERIDDRHELEALTYLASRATRDA